MLTIFFLFSKILSYLILRSLIEKHEPLDRGLPDLWIVMTLRNRTAVPHSPSLMTIAIFLLGFMAMASSALADQITLRNFDIISDRKIVEFDEDGVKLDDGRTITWDDIDQGTVEAAKQAAFDKMLADLGTPLFRIRQRLKFGDYKALLEHAEAVYPRYVGRSSPTAYMVFQSLMWARIAAGQRELAVEPYLRAYEYLRISREKPSLPGDRQLEFDPITALTPTLPPVWFDEAAAKTALNGVREAARAMKSPYPEGVFIYYGTLALAAGEHDQAREILKLVQGRQRSTEELKLIALAQLEVVTGEPDRDVANVEASVDSMLPGNRPVAYYWLGMAKSGHADKPKRLEGVLDLLRIPALYGEQSPELAGAGLFHAMNTLSDLDDLKGSLALRRELQVRYAHTVHAARLRTANSTPASN